ncbi:hypothetical protein GCM10010420_07120 [Streptomyces glaucosporus]|uniref:Uncharacterized protein n=1 Tax=Streptomyces glaucosporus TaxID=284044 RepID=A0ABN3HRY4_9ACTN
MTSAVPSQLLPTNSTSLSPLAPASAGVAADAGTAAEAASTRAAAQPASRRERRRRGEGRWGDVVVVMARSLIGRTGGVTGGNLAAARAADQMRGKPKSVAGKGVRPVQCPP